MNLHPINQQSFDESASYRYAVIQGTCILLISNHTTGQYITTCTAQKANVTGKSGELAHSYSSAHLWVHVWTHACRCIHTNARIYRHIHISMYVHTYIHVCTIHTKMMHVWLNTSWKYFWRIPEKIRVCWLVNVLKLENHVLPCMYVCMYFNIC